MAIAKEKERDKPRDTGPGRYPSVADGSGSARYWS
jgi:hypothetical protein